MRKLWASIWTLLVLSLASFLSPKTYWECRECNCLHLTILLNGGRKALALLTKRDVIGPEDRAGTSWPPFFSDSSCESGRCHSTLLAKVKFWLCESKWQNSSNFTSARTSSCAYSSQVRREQVYPCQLPPPHPSQMFNMEYLAFPSAAVFIIRNTLLFCQLCSVFF